MNSDENLNPIDNTFPQIDIGEITNLNKDLTNRTQRFIEPFHKPLEEQKQNFNILNNQSLPGSNKNQAKEYSRVLDTSAARGKESSVTSDPSNILEAFELGNEKMRQGDYIGAIKCYKNARKADKKFYKERYNCAVAYYCLNEVLKALKNMEAAVKINTKESKPCVMLGQLYDRGCNKGYDHVKYYKEALERDKNNSEAYLILGNKCAHSPRPFKSIEKYQKAIDTYFEDSSSISLDFTAIQESFLGEEFSIDKFMEFSFAEEMDKLKGNIGFKAYLNQAQVLIRERRYVEAANIYEQIAFKYPKFRVIIYYRHAKLNILQKDYLGAVQKLAGVFIPPKINQCQLTVEKNVNKIDEKDIEPLKKQAEKVQNFIRMGNYKEALKRFEEYSGDYLSNWQLTKIYIVLGREQEAKNRLEKMCSNLEKISIPYRLVIVPFDTTIKTLTETEKMHYRSSYEVGIELNSNDSSLSNINKLSIANAEKSRESKKQEMPAGPLKIKNIIIIPSPLDETENQENTTDPLIRYLRFGNRRLSLGEYKHAAREYAKALDLNSTCFEVLYNYGICLYCQNKLPEAIGKLEAAAKQRPNDSDIYTMLGLTYQKQGEEKKANLNYLEAIKKDRFNSVAFLLWGILFTEQKRYKRAMGKFNKAFITASYNEKPDPANLDLLGQWDDPEDSPLQDNNQEEMVLIDFSEESFSSSSALDKLVCDINHREVNIAISAYLNIAQVSALLKYDKTTIAICQNIISNFGVTKYKNAACAILYNLYMNRGNYDKAAKMFAEFLTSQSISLSNEETTIEQDVEEDRGLSKVIGKKGNDFLRKRDYNAAARSFCKSYEKNKNGFLANHNMAKIKAIEGKIEETAQYLEAAHSYNPRAFQKTQFKSVDLECHLKTL